MWTFLERAFQGSLKKPGNVFRLSIVFVLVCSFILTIFESIIPPASGQNLPLMIFGMSLIMCILIFVEGKTAALLLSITLVGTVVAREEFIIKITHMIRSNPEQLGTYLGDYTEQTQLKDVASIGEIVASEINKRFGDRIEQSEKEQIVRIVTRVQLANTLDRINIKGNARLLRWFKDDRNMWLIRIEGLQDNQFFNRHARILVREGAIDCTLGEPLASRTELAKCRLTPLGKELAALVEEQDTLSVQFPAPEVPPDQKPPADAAEKLPSDRTNVREESTLN